MSYSMISKVAWTCAIAVFSASTAFAQSDMFELKPIWSQQTDFGSIGLTTDQHHGGTARPFFKERRSAPRSG